MTDTTKESIRENVQVFKKDNRNEVNDVINRLNKANLEKTELLDKMVSVLKTARASMDAMILEIRIAKQFPEENNLERVLQLGHEAIWSLANNFTDLESGIQSRISMISDAKEYLAK